ncbi:hypothetical protein PMAYCL1PPCAC_02528, partial [Pristionchus mayeri]
NPLHPSPFPSFLFLPRCPFSSMESHLFSFLFIQTPPFFLRLFSPCLPRKICQSESIAPSSDMPHSVERSRSLHSALKKAVRTVDERKVVHFADSMGLDLVQVKCVFPYNSSDEELLSSSPSLLIKPATGGKGGTTTVSRMIPHSGSFNDARFLQLHAPSWNVPKEYHQVNKELLNRTVSNGVCLKSSNVIGMTFTAIVSVYNYSYHKQVFVRYSLDGWRSHIEIQARYISSHPQENTDSFSFSIFLPHSMPVGAKCEFALRYKCGHREFWDNNNGSNYVIECATMASHYGSSLSSHHDRPVFY